MKKTMNLWIFLSLFTVMVISFFLLKGQLEPMNASLEQRLNGIKAQQTELQTEETQIKEELEICSSDAYIEKEAREKYDYMFEDEFRIEIVNPEMLYEDGKVPDRSPQ